MSKRNRIGIETIERAVVLTNYGSFWQHYALRRVLKRFGYEPFRCESHPEVNVLREWMVPFRIARVWLLSLIGLRRRPHILDFVRPFLQFRFVKDYHRLIGPILERDRGADAYLAGGDSVWCGKNRHCFLLDRASGIRRISYAPSSVWYKKYEDAVWRKHMAEVVKTFNALSVREKAGAEVVKKIDSTCVVEQCIDPVFLLSAEEWRKLVEKNDIRKRLTEKSIVYYSVNATTYEDLHWELMRDCAKLLGCRLSAVGIQGSNKFIPPSAWVRPSPLEFLQMIIDADYVVTNSFHGLVFAILLHNQ